MKTTEGGGRVGEGILLKGGKSKINPGRAVTRGLQEQGYGRGAWSRVSGEQGPTCDGNTMTWEQGKRGGGRGSQGGLFFTR